MWPRVYVRSSLAQASPLIAGKSYPVQAFDMRVKGLKAWVRGVAERSRMRFRFKTPPAEERSLLMRRQGKRSAPRQASQWQARALKTSGNGVKAVKPEAVDAAQEGLCFTLTVSFTLLKSSAGASRDLASRATRSETSRLLQMKSHQTARRLCASFCFR